MPKARSSAGSGCLALFAVPFVGTGLVTLYLLVQELARGPSDWDRLLLLSIFPPVFGGAGLAMLFGSRWASGRQARKRS